MRGFRDSLRRHRGLALGFISMSFFAMVDSGNYVYAYQLHDQEQRQAEEFFADLLDLPTSADLSSPLERAKARVADIQGRASGIVEDGRSWLAELSARLPEPTPKPVMQIAPLQIETDEPPPSAELLRDPKPESRIASKLTVSELDQKPPIKTSVPSTRFPVEQFEAKSSKVTKRAAGRRIANPEPNQAIRSKKYCERDHRAGRKPRQVARADVRLRPQRDLDPKWGVQRSPLGALHEKRGTSWDQAWLLQQLLAATGVDARFEWGVEIVDFVLINRAGISDRVRAADYFATAGTPIQLKQGGARIQHVGLRAFVDYIPNRGTIFGDGDRWIHMDASLKVFDTATAQRADGTEFSLADYLTSGTTDSRLADFEPALQNVGYDPSTIRPEQTVKSQDFPFLPGILRGKIVDVAGLSATIPASRQQSLNIKIHRVDGAPLLEWSTPISDLYR